MPHLLKALHTSPHLGELRRALLRRRGVLTDFLVLAVRLFTENVVTEVKEGLEGGLLLFHRDVVGRFNDVN